MENKICQYLKHKRQVAGLSQQRVATAIGIERREMISRRENGVTKWALDEVCLFAQLLDETLSEFWRGFEEFDSGT